MYEIVTITKVLPKQMVEVVCLSSACAGCKGETFCNTKGKKFEAFNTDNLNLAEGDQVELFLTTGRTIAGTLITLIFPLLLFPVAYFLAKFGNLSEGPAFLSGLAGILVGFVLVFFYFRKTKAKYMPTITRVSAES